MSPEPPPLQRSDESAITLGTAVCGVDDSPQSAEAVRQAIELTEEDGRLWAVAVWDPGLTMHAGIHAAEVAVELRQKAVASLQRTRRSFPAVEPMLIRGNEVAGLLASATNLEADLVAVASHGTSRPAGIVFGSMATAMVHYAPCCVLVAREPGVEEAFPRVILHAGDGSPDSLEAARLSGRIAARHKATVATLHVGEGSDRGAAVAEEAAAMIESGGSEPVIELADGRAHRRIVEFAGKIGASLIVVGSRGLTGLKAIGSVSERVAHRGSCSVLVVRRPAPPVEERFEG